MTQLISPAYRAEQQSLHERDDAYGSRGFNWGYVVAGIAVIERCKSVIDYGCGKATLGRTLRGASLFVQSYDPGIPQHAQRPVRADLVACLDVLEHIEPECLDAVLDDLCALTQKILFVAISCRLAGRWLSDGRNAHLIVEDGERWWRPKFEARSMHVRRVWRTGLIEWVAMLAR